MSWFFSCFSSKRKKNNSQNQNSNEELPRAKSQLIQHKQSQLKSSKYKNISKINIPSKISKHSVIRNQNYTEISDKSTGLKIYLTDQQLNFQMDYQDGISHNLTINTFNYKPQNQNPQLLYYQHYNQTKLDQKAQQKDIKTKQKPIKMQEKQNQHEQNFRDQIQQQPTGF